MRSNPNPQLTPADVASSVIRLEKAMRTFKSARTLSNKQDMIAAYIQILAMKQPTEFNRKTTEGVMNRHAVRDRLHGLDENALLRTVSEVLMPNSEGEF